MRKMEYLTSCVGSTARLIHAMQDRARDITYRTFRKHCAGVDEWAASVGYAVGRKKGLHLQDDFAVSFYKSWYAGKPCYYVRWSSIEHIWV